MHGDFRKMEHKGCYSRNSSLPLEYILIILFKICFAESNFTQIARDMTTLQFKLQKYLLYHVKNWA